MPNAIEGVATAFPAFIGYSEKAATFGEPAWIASLAQYEAAFGAAAADGFRLREAMRLFYANGGDDALVLSVGPYDAATSDPAPLLAGLDRIGGENRPTLLLIPDALRLSREDYHQVARAMIGQGATLGDRIAILDVHGGGEPSAWSVEGSAPLIAAFRSGVGGLAAPSYGAAYYPWLLTPSGKAMPPSGAIAGIYAQVDSRDGVWKAPANVAIQGDVAGLAVRYGDHDQGALNQPIDGLAVNAIRSFAGLGNMVWGARTLDGNSGDFRYVPVRRMLIWIEQSIRSRLTALAAAPNVSATWAAALALVDNFLIEVWRRGGLQGATPRNAFFVRCGLGTTMTQGDIDNGILRVSIGVAPSRPAEFVILTVQQMMQTAPDG
jgi:phage tail sheath protein FI